MKLNEFKTVLSRILKHNQRLSIEGKPVKQYLVPMAWGDPGLGKTDMVEAIAQEFEWEMIYADLATRDPAELGGMPWVKDGRSIRCRPDWLPPEGEGILFLDELPQAGIANLNIVATLIREHRIGEHHLPRGWMVVCAGNHPHNRAGTMTMPSHVRNRLMDLKIEADPASWALWARAAQINPILIAYNRARGGEFHHRFSPTDNASPTPRSWAASDQVLQLGLSEALEQECLAGLVGDAAAADLAGFRKLVASLPDVDQIIADPDNSVLPQDAMTSYALMGALSTHAKPGNFAAILTYLARLPEQEFAVACVLDATARSPALTMTAAYQHWAVDHGSLLSGQ